jgi:uncharacterized protein (TIGR01777 family)
MKPRILLAGGSGFIGQALSRLLLSKNYEVVVLTRAPSHQEDVVRHVHWDGHKIEPWNRHLAYQGHRLEAEATFDNWVETLNGARAIVNLAGKNVNCRHTPENRREIMDSRVNSVRLLGEAIGRCAQPPEVFAQASGIALYGHAGDRWCDENAPRGNGFLADVSREWESAFNEIRALATRKCVLRIGPVLGPNGGLLEPLTRLTKSFLGGHVGSGRQYFSWIHIVDLTRMFLSAIERDDIAGVFNAVAPNPVPNAEFMRELRSALHRPWSPPVPAFAAKIGAWIMGTDATLALTGQRCAPKHFLEKNFEFEFPKLREALANIFPNQ